MTDKDRKITIAWAMKTLEFVVWDRYTDTGHTLTAFGWIERPHDHYKDFVIVEHYIGTADVFFTTSSAQYSDKISKMLFGEEGQHTTCMRVEDGFEKFDIPNVVKLKTQ